VGLEILHRNSHKRQRWWTRMRGMLPLCLIVQHKTMSGGEGGANFDVVLLHFCS
jgi:hypothetical protein